MTTQKTLKRRVHARAAKTGESYTAARAQLLLALGHEKLPDAEAADRVKLMWRERLTALKDLLESR